MAHKIGLALIALLGMSNCEIYSQSNHYVLGSAPPLVAFTGQSKHNEDDSNSHGVTLGEHHVQLGILNFVGGQGHHQDSDDDGHHHKRGDSSKKQREFSGKKKRNTSVGKKKEVSVDRKKKDASTDRRKKSVDKSKKDPSTKKRVSAGKKKASVEKKKVSVDKKRQSPEGRRQSSVDRKRRSPRKQSSVGRSRSNSRDKVPVPVFKNLRYVDNDKHGQFEKAPITIVTAPLVSTAEIEQHKVGTNKVKGKSNCPQCLEENHQAKETKKSAAKSIQRYDELLKTKIEAPIKNVEVHDKEEESSEDNKGRQADGYTGAKINKSRLNKQLANGEKNEHRKFVVGSVVIPHQSNESEEQDSGHGHINHSHTYHSNHKHHHNHH